MTPRNRRLAPEPVLLDVVDVADPEQARVAPPRASMEARPSGSGRFIYAVRAVTGASLVLGLSMTVAWAARRHVLTSPRFAVTDVVVLGAHTRTADAVAEEAGIAKGMNIFALDLERARGKLLADPWIETATLARRLPGKIVVQVSERELGAVVALPETYLAARDGRIFKKLEVGDPDDVPIITGLTSDMVAQDRDGVEQTIVRALDLAGDYEHGPLAARSPLEEIHVSNGGELTLVVGKDAVDLQLGFPPYRRKLEESARIFTELEHRGAHASVVMLDDAARPDRVVVRTRQ